MTTSAIKFLLGAAAIGATMTIGASAYAYWGDGWGAPWSEPGWGGGPWSEPGGWGGGPLSQPGWGGGPWSEPGFPSSGYGGALDRTHERQSAMLDHKAAMQAVARMLSGRRSFDRAEAVGLARQIEASAGDNLTRSFAPGDWRRSPLSRARIAPGDMETFKANADALKQAAGELADALEQQPSAEDVRAGRAWSPNWRMGGPYSGWGNEGGAVTPEAFAAYRRLQATCYSCHANFRSAWR